MKCRRLKIETDAGGNILRRDVVWFGSYGLNHDGTAKFYNKDNKSDNYGSGQIAIADSLTQRLNVLQGELWYAVNEGMPLWDSHKNEAALDVYITSTILKHKNVASIIDFNSNIEQRGTDQYQTYSASVKILTIYGELNISTEQSL